MRARKPRGASRPKPHRSTTETPKLRRRRRRSSRPTPAWLMTRQDLDEMARRRCLLVLSVLSGERSAQEAAEQERISPQTYQKYETRALEAMLAALMPDASPDGVAASSSRRIEDLEKRIAQLERDKRRAEHLLLLTRQIVRPGPVTTGAGRKPGSRSRPKSGAAGAGSSRRSKPTSATPTPTSTPATGPASTAAPTAASTPTPAGEGAR